VHLDPAFRYRKFDCFAGRCPPSHTTPRVRLLDVDAEIGNVTTAIAKVGIVDAGARWRAIVADMENLAERGASLSQIEAAREGLRTLMGEIWIRPEPGKVIARLGLRIPAFTPHVNGEEVVAGARSAPCFDEVEVRIRAA